MKIDQHRHLPLLLMAAASIAPATTLHAAKKQVIAPSYAWTMIPPLGLHQPATIDTCFLNYSRRSVPADISDAYATTGNLGAEGINMIFLEREPMSDFFFRDALRAWIPSLTDMTFYNTRLPMTLLSYNTGGSKETAQDRLSATFSGNINRRAQVGAMVDYLYSKGSYNYQATKDLIWGLSGSYMGDRYEFQGYLNHYNLLNKENGGITDDRYITDPAEIQGGSTSVSAKNIPTRLTDAHSKVVGTELVLNNRYKVGFYREDTVNDTTVTRTYVPVSSFIWTLKYNEAKHIFRNDAPGEAADMWDNTYLSTDGTRDRTTYSTLTNTLGISLLEGFNKYAKAGLAAFITHQLRTYHQTTDTVNLADEPASLSPYPVDRVPAKATDNLLWVGAQLTKQQGSLLTYEATARLGIAGPVAADLDITGRVSTRFKLGRDSVTIAAYGSFVNQEAPYLMNHYVSNHFIWDNDFGKERRFRVGGLLDFPLTRTRLNIGVENIQNYIYFNDLSLPAQYGSSLQVFSATLSQDLRFKAFNWENRLTYQTSTVENVLSLPKLAIYSNLYFLFRVAKVLHVQLGVDMDYYTRYYAPAYQPATMSFHTQSEMKLGNYPLMNAYINMKLSKARFYVLYSHFNKGMFGGDNYFSSPHYPLNPSRFLMGVSVDLAN